jgi:hypothetical protein
VVRGKQIALKKHSTTKGTKITNCKQSPFLLFRVVRVVRGKKVAVKVPKRRNQQFIPVILMAIRIFY